MAGIPLYVFISKPKFDFDQLNWLIVIKTCPIMYFSDFIIFIMPYLLSE